MIIKVTDDEGESKPEDIAEGIEYAADHGAKIINISLGTNIFSQHLQSAVSYAKSKGCIIVSCSGNEDRNFLQYPSQSPEVISVGASEGKDKAYFSNYNAGLKLLAPGQFIKGANSHGGIIERAGTSASAPIVSGLLAIILSKYPDITNQQLEKCIYYSSDDIKKGLYSYTQGRDIYSGYGIVDTYNTLISAKKLESDEFLRNVNIKYKNNWYSESVSFFIEKGFMNDLEFNPDQNLKMSDFERLLDNFCKMLIDNNINSWHYNNNIEENDPNELTVSRSDLVEIVLNRLMLKIPKENVCSNIFDDFSKIPKNQKSVITFAYQNGFVNGRGNNMFYPNETATTAELCQLLYNIYIYFSIKLE